jgi:small-conductance mechanosensitive channel
MTSLPKIVFALVLWLGAVTLGTAQGVIRFANFGPSVDAPFFAADGTNLLAGSNYVAALYVAPTNGGGFSPVGPIQGFRLGTDAGRWFPVNVTLVGIGAGTTIRVQVRFWDQSRIPNATFDQAEAGGAEIGIAEIPALTLEPNGIPTPLFGLQSASLIPTLTLSRGNPLTAFDPADPPTGQPPKVGTRLRTMLPLLRIVLLVAVAVLAVLVVLSELGVNTAPLIAGASVFGLAISFGSQALVKDVVSGIFFMADDAFRVGEYIDTGKLKGTVEGMTVRSLKLRHQNGPLHTIPFGELSSVTNFSRHFSTVKFTIRLVRDVDLEHVRKTVKKVGLEMMSDPEIQPEMILPLKLQGIVDIDQTAVVCRLKFTCKPQKPTWVQRLALKRLYDAFRERDIQFAGPATITTTPGAVVASPQPAPIRLAGTAPDAKSPSG